MNLGPQIVYIVSIKKTRLWLHRPLEKCGAVVELHRISGQNHGAGQISIIPKPECFGDFGEVPLLNHHFG